MCGSSMIRRKDASGPFWGCFKFRGCEVTREKDIRRPEIFKPVPEEYV